MEYTFRVVGRLLSGERWQATYSVSESQVKGAGAGTVCRTVIPVRES